VVIRILRPLVGRKWILLELVENHFDRFLELRVATLACERGVHFDLDVRSDAPILDFPVSLELFVMSLVLC
jgi:hypothetical protein